MKVIGFLDKKDLLYQKYRTVFLKMGPELSTREIGCKCFYRFLKILDEIHIGLCSFEEVHSYWQDTSSVIYILHMKKHNKVEDLSICL